eukprot:m.74002 g.74002  ORF g.74002 m.74002 type:complete len:79 (+) comp12384_c0_seq3:444-680(+)
MFVARNKAKFMKMPSQLVQSIRDADIEVATALGSFLSTVRFRTTNTLKTHSWYSATPKRTANKLHAHINFHSPTRVNT